MNVGASRENAIAIVTLAAVALALFVAYQESSATPIRAAVASHDVQCSNVAQDDSVYFVGCGGLF